MSLSIAMIRPANAEEWDTLWRQCDHATYFHSREWAEIWSVYTKGGMRPDPKLVVFSDGKKALLPLSCNLLLKRLVRYYVSSPAGTFGGWIAADPLEAEHAALLTNCMITGFGNMAWRLSPYDDALLHLNVRTYSNEETHSLSLKEGFHAIFKGWTKGHKSAVAKARREEVSVRMGSTLDDWHSYYRVYEASLRRWGGRASSRYHWEIFEEMLRRRSNHIRLWLAIHRDKVVAGALCFYAKRHVVYWHGAALEDYFPLRPVHLLMYEAIKDACGGGYFWFDFNPSGPHEGVRGFKKSFGAIPLPCPVVTVETRLLRFMKKFGPILKRFLGYDLSFLQ